MRSAFGLGFILGPAIGGFAGNVDPRLPFWIAAGFSLLNTLYGIFILPESLRPGAPHGGARLEARQPDRRRSNCYAATANSSGLRTVTFIALVAHEALPNLWVLYLHRTVRLGPTRHRLGTRAGRRHASSFTAALLVGPVVKRFGERRTLLVGL